MLLKIKWMFFYILLFCFMSGCNGLSRHKTEDFITDPEVASDGIIGISGRHLINNKNQILRLQGVAFGNEVWSNPATPSTNHHSAADYQRVKSMNMNVIRFYLNYGIFEDDHNPYVYKETGFDWLNSNIDWARQNNIYLVLNMHYPQGGYQSQTNGDALWTEDATGDANRSRLKALWKEIANRYKDEPAILGYDLVNEPVPKGPWTQWQTLAQELVDEIRLVDTNHIIIIEKTGGEYDEWKSIEELAENFFLVNDSQNKIMYTFHFYEPITYTHQLFDWAGLGEGGVYPDEDIFYYSDLTWSTATHNNPKIHEGNSSWNYFTGMHYQVNDESIKIGKPVVVGANVQGGTVFFDEIVVSEFDDQLNFVREVATISVSNGDSWNYWSYNNDGTGSLITVDGYNDLTCFSITGSSGDANITLNNYDMIVNQGYYYQISGYMKGNLVPQDANALFRIDFYSTEEQVFHRNKEYGEHIFNKYLQFGIENNVPLYLGEFGVGVHCFENNKGGLTWVSDMIDIALDHNVAFTYHTYLEDNFGIYYGNGPVDVNNANDALINLFKNHLR
jgi:endoglucanase